MLFNGTENQGGHMACVCVNVYVCACLCGGGGRCFADLWGSKLKRVCTKKKTGLLMLTLKWYKCICVICRLFKIAADINMSKFSKKCCRGFFKRSLQSLKSQELLGESSSCTSFYLSHSTGSKSWNLTSFVLRKVESRVEVMESTVRFGSSPRS